MSRDDVKEQSYPPFMVFAWAWGLSAAALVGWAVIAATLERHAHYSVGQALAVPEAIVGFLATLLVIWIVAVILWAWQGYQRPLTADGAENRRD